ncbi:hypothetical protein VNO78_12187 [Psophocarpus tetragonolobus]|uniref:Transmembrane protein n=1 Tax=Psophocarpus tetragonolobus TaxID=3891 RepID=A0AAN9SNM9_PSOTE
MAPNNFSNLLSEYRKIIKPNSLHFHTLSLIFLFPITLSLLLSLTLSHLFNNFNFFTHQQPSTITNPNLSFTPHSLFFNLFHSLLALVFSTCGVISITYSTFHFFYNQQVKLSSTINSITTSFLPLFATTIVSQLIFFLISLFHLLLFLLLHVTIPHSSPYTIAFFVALPLLLVLTHLQVNWTLVPVIVVVESCWGLEPLRRSARLIKGMKGLSLSSFLFYGVFSWIMVWNVLLTSSIGTTNDIVALALFKRSFIVFQSYLLALFMLSNIGFNTILYIYCKANHGEIVEKFEKDGVSVLPFNEEKVSNVV